jgi:hypothetical protein
MLIMHFPKLLSLLIPMSLLGATPSDPQDSDSQDSSSQASAARRIAIATIANGLPVDGCSYPVTIRGTDYAPDPASVDDIGDLVPAGGTITVLIRYRLTGRTGTVECGFGTSRTLPEISFRVIQVLE